MFCITPEGKLKSMIKKQILVHKKGKKERERGRGRERGRKSKREREKRRAELV